MDGRDKSVAWRARACRAGVLVLALGWMGSVARSDSERTSVSVTWDPNPEPTVVDYNIYYSLRSHDYHVPIPSGGSTNFVVSNLKAGHQYFFAVKAVDEWGQVSDFSQEVGNLIPALCDQLPQVIAIPDPILPEALLLTFLSAPGTKYRVQASDDQQTWQTVWTSGIGDGFPMEFVDRLVPDLTRRTYRVEVIGHFLESSTPLALSLATAPKTGTQIQFDAFYGRIYDLQASADGVVWTELWTSVSTTNNEVLEYVDDRPDLPPQQYRVLVAADPLGPYWGSCGGFLNDPPTILPVDRTAKEAAVGRVSEPILFTLDDPDTPLDLLQLSVTTSDPALVAPSNIVFVGSGPHRSFRVTPGTEQIGTATITVTAFDGENSASTTFDIDVLRSLPDNPALTIDTHGSGTVTPDFNGQALTVGQRYTVTAVPAPGQVFVGWTGPFQSASPRLSFVMDRGMVIEANFILNPFPAVAGSYHGLIAVKDALLPQVAGAVQVTTTARGSYSGKVILGGHTHSFSGHLALDLSITNSLPRRGLAPLAVQLALVGGTSARGQLSDGATVLDWSAHRAAYDARLNPAPSQGTYTVAFLNSDRGLPGPDGAGFGTVKVDPGGAVTFAGTLPDNTRVATRVWLSKDGFWPLYASLYAGQGFISGWLSLTNHSTNDISGETRWVRTGLARNKYYPAGFTNSFAAIGSGYIRPSALPYPVLSSTPMSIGFSGGDLLSPVVNTIALDEKNRVVSLGPNKLSLAVSLSSGLFSGKVVDPATARSCTFRGALLQTQAIGAGFLLGTNHSALVSIGF